MPFWLRNWEPALIVMFPALPDPVLLAVIDDPPCRVTDSVAAIATVPPNPGPELLVLIVVPWSMVEILRIEYSIPGRCCASRIGMNVGALG